MPSSVRTEQGYLEQALKKSWEGLASVSYFGRDFSITSSYYRAVDSLIAEEETKNALLAYVSGASYVDCTIKSKTSDIERILAKFKIGRMEIKIDRMVFVKPLIHCLSTFSGRM